MKISVLIIAHNEEENIGKCIESLLNQTQKADEIILVVHNTSDRTAEIAKQYSVKTTLYNGPQGIVAARIEGLKHVSGDIIICIDGDSYASANWIAEMSRVLLNGNILVGSWVRFEGTFFGEFTSFFNKFFCKTEGKKSCPWIWGPSFAFWKKDKEKVVEIYNKSIELTAKLNLSRNPEDYWLALFMGREGKLEVTNRTYVFNRTKEISNAQAIKRNRENIQNGLKIRTYFHKNFNKNML